MNCEHWDCGWCYHVDGPKNGCLGSNNCPFKEYKTMTEKYKALIIGAGSIGAMKPSEFDSPESNQIYTHAHACYSHPQIDLVGIVDIDVEKAEKAGNKWNTYWANNYNIILMREQPDIIIVAVDTANHFKTLVDIIGYEPKAIICEKPFCSNYAEASEIIGLCEQAGIKLIINYTRSFVPELKQLSDDLKNGEYGEIYNFTLRYSRGLLREASHAFHWCLQTFGNKLVRLQKEGNGYFYNEVEKGDYNPLLHYIANNCGNVVFIPIGGAYSTYNADIYTEKGRIELLNNWKTIRFHKLTKSTYGDYPATGLLFEDKQTQMDQALTFLLDFTLKNLYNTNIDNSSALEVHKHLKLNA